MVKLQESRKTISTHCRICLVTWQLKFYTAIFRIYQYDKFPKFENYFVPTYYMFFLKESIDHFLGVDFKNNNHTSHKLNIGFVHKGPRKILLESGSRLNLSAPWKLDLCTRFQTIYPRVIFHKDFAVPFSAWIVKPLLRNKVSTGIFHHCTNNFANTSRKTHFSW